MTRMDDLGEEFTIKFVDDFCNVECRVRVSVRLRNRVSVRLVLVLIGLELQWGQNVATLVCISPSRTKKNTDHH